MTFCFAPISFSCQPPLDPEDFIAHYRSFAYFAHGTAYVNSTRAFLAFALKRCRRFPENHSHPYVLGLGHAELRSALQLVHDPKSPDAPLSALVGILCDLTFR